MTNNDQPDWNDLQNEQAETNATQIDKLWAKAKSLPIYFWTMLFVVGITLSYTIRLNYVIKPQIEIEQKQKHQLRQDLEEVRLELKEARAEIKAKDLTIENCLTAHAIENKEIVLMRNNLRHKTIAKQFYQAVASELAGRPKINMDYHLDKMFSNNHERASLIKETWVKDALDLGAINVSELVGKRVNLVKHKETFEAIAAIKKVIKRNAKATKTVIEADKIIDLSWEQECSGE